MKTLFFDRSINHYTKWRSLKSTLTLLVSRCCSVWDSLEPVRTKVKSLSRRYVIQNIPTGLTASLQALRNLTLNKRHLVGFVMLLMAVVSIFGHQLFFNMYSEPHDVCQLLGFRSGEVGQCFNRSTGEGWCYVSWFWYLDTIRYCLVAIFGAVGLILFVPPKYSLSFIPFSLLQAAGWTYLLHFTFFTYSHETRIIIPDRAIIAMGLALGFSIVMSADYLLYWYNHKALGNWTKFVGVAEMDLPAEQKEPIYRKLAKDFREIQKTI